MSDNPYDPEEVDARVEFEESSGEPRVVPAFWFEGYVRSLENGNEAYIPTGVQTWMARIVGAEPGTLRYRVVVDDADGRGAHDADEGERSTEQARQQRARARHLDERPSVNALIAVVAPVIFFQFRHGVILRL